MKNKILKKVILGSNIKEENKWDGRVLLEMDRDVWDTLETLIEICRSTHNASLTQISTSDHHRVQKMQQEAYEILGNYFAWEVLENIISEESLV